MQVQPDGPGLRDRAPLSPGPQAFRPGSIAPEPPAFESAHIYIRVYTLDSTKRSADWPGWVAPQWGGSGRCLRGLPAGCAPGLPVLRGGGLNRLIVTGRIHVDSYETY